LQPAHGAHPRRTVEPSRHVVDAGAAACRAGTHAPAGGNLRYQAP